VDDAAGRGPLLTWCLEDKSLHVKLSIAMFTDGANHEMRSAKLPEPPLRSPGDPELKFCAVKEEWVARSTSDVLPRDVKAKFLRCNWPWWGDGA
jgi:hypothetical protein